jgi:protein SCO1/2
MTLSQLNAVDQRLAQQGLDQDTAYLMISVDPRRDTPERLGQYVTYFNKNFQGATGTPEELEKLAKQLGIFYKLNDQEDAENYTVDHSSAIILIDPDIKLRAIFTHPDQPDSLIADFTQIRTRYQTTR